MRIYGTLESDGSPVSEAMLAIEVDTPLMSPVSLRTVTIGTPPTTDANIKNVSLTDEYFDPIDTFYIPIPAPQPPIPEKYWAHVEVTVETLITLPEGATVAFTIYDNNSVCIGSGMQSRKPIPEGTYNFTMSVPINAWATTGKATIYASVYTKRPIQGGYPLCPEKTATFTILRGSGDSGGSSGFGGTGGTGTNGTYESEFRLSPEPNIGTYTIHCNALVEQTLKQESETFEVKAASYPPQASFTYTPPQPWINGTTIFDASASTPEGEDDTIVSYKWAFGDNNFGVGKIASHSYNQSATYLVTLNVTDSEGLWCTTSKLVTVSPVTGPTANFTYSPPEPFVYGTTTFDASSSTLGWNGTTNPPIVRYEWNFGDNTDPVIEYDPTTTHIYLTNDTFTVTLTVTDSEGRLDTISQNITVIVVDVMHDISIMSIVYTPTVAYQNATPPVDVAVVVRNNGTVLETFNVTAYYNVSSTEWMLIETQNVTQLYPLGQTTVHLAWNTSTVQLYVDYRIKVETSTIPGDINPSDNTIIGNTIIVKGPGDVDGDGYVGPADVWTYLAPAYGSYIGDSNYDPDCDFDFDGYVGPTDVWIYLAPNYGKNWKA